MEHDLTCDVILQKPFLPSDDKIILNSEAVLHEVDQEKVSSNWKKCQEFLSGDQAEQPYHTITFPFSIMQLESCGFKTAIEFSQKKAVWRQRSTDFQLVHGFSVLLSAACYTPEQIFRWIHSANEASTSRCVAWLATRQQFQFCNFSWIQPTQRSWAVHACLPLVLDVAADHSWLWCENMATVIIWGCKGWKILNWPV